jgi:glycosyltransferase involved in cell wall biosynthesis
MTEPLVSICIPTFNGEKYLRECLDSCISQQYPNYEIVICDDGSTDATVEIIEGYAKRNAAIRFFKNDRNKGLVGNWNHCIQMARGEWIKFVFQDDYITADCLREFAAAISPSTVLMVSERNFILPADPSTDLVDYYKNRVRTLRNTTDQKTYSYSPVLISVIAIENMCMNFIGEPSLTFFRKDVVETLGYYNSALKQICDFEFALRIAAKHGLKYIPKAVCAFRIHRQSTTSTNIEKNFFELRYIEPLLFAYFLLYNPRHKDLRKHLNFFQMLKLKLYFKLKAYQANLINLKENRDHYLFRDAPGDFKEISENKNGSFLIRLINRVKK